jgi:integrase
MRGERHKKNHLFKAKELRSLIEAASPQLKAMLLLGINAAMGNEDCATLTKSTIQGKWLVFPRPKTKVGRKVALWPETIEALQAAIAQRPEPKDEAHTDYVFITRCHEPWTPKGKNGDSPITKETVKLLKKLGLHGKGLGFYACRHTFETIASDAKDQIALNHIMGHIDYSMSATYRERISNRRLFDVAQFVRNWLFRRKSRRDKAPPAAPSSASEPLGDSETPQDQAG